LGSSAVGFGGPQVRVAAILGPALFLWGAAVGYLLDMFRSHNFAHRDAPTSRPARAGVPRPGLVC
jgi:hypothetical protein